MCGFVDFQHFATVGHTARLFLYEHIKFLFHVVPVSPSQQQAPILEAYSPIAIMLPCQHHHKFLLSTCKEHSAITVKPSKNIPTPEVGNI